MYLNSAACSSVWEEGGDMAAAVGVIGGAGGAGDGGVSFLR